MNVVQKILVAIPLVLVSLMPTVPASAHTNEERTNPVNGSTVEVGIQTVSVAFTDQILNLADSSEIVITSSNGEQVEITCIEVSKKSLSAEAYIPAPGKYKVTWRTVAKDGHPITGKFGFTATGKTSSADFTSCKEINQDKTIIDKPTSGKSTPVNKSDDSLIVWPFWTVGILVIGIGSYTVIKRSKSKA